MRQHEIKVGAKVHDLFVHADESPGTIMLKISTADGGSWWAVAPRNGESNPPRWYWMTQGQLEQDRYKLFVARPKVGDLVTHNTFKSSKFSRVLTSTFQGSDETWAVVTGISGRGYECFRLSELRVVEPPNPEAVPGE